MNDTTTTYAGADWIRDDARKPLSEFGARAADLIGWWLRGIYHEQKMALRTDWSNPRFVTLTIPCHGWATYDFAHWTRLVVGAHDRAIRVEIEPAAPHVMRLWLHPREREGNVMERHPTIEQAIEAAREDR